MHLEKTTKIAASHSPDIKRLMLAMGIKDEMVAAFSLSVAGPGELITVTVERYLTEAQMAALADELEANPLQAVEAGN